MVSVSLSMGDGSWSNAWPTSVGHTSGHFEVNTPSSVASQDRWPGPDPNDHTVMCLLAEDNTIMVKIHFDGSSYASWCVITFIFGLFHSANTIVKALAGTTTKYEYVNHW
jgi:hypothetical protein